MNMQFRFLEVSGHNLSQFSDLRFPFTMFTLQASFKPLLLKRGVGGGGKNPFVEVTVNSKEENS